VSGTPVWRVWGDGRDPVFEGSETDAKAKLIELDEADPKRYLYLEDPDGNEYTYNPVTEKWMDA